VKTSRTAARAIRRIVRVVAVAAATVLAACNYTSLYGPPDVKETSISVDFCAPNAPAWVAFRDGDGAWTRSAAEVTGGVHSFRHTFKSDRAEMATLTHLSGSATFLSVMFAAPEELPASGDTLTADCVGALPLTVFGSVSGLPAGGAATVSSGFSLFSSVPAGQSTFKLRGLADRPQDLLAARIDPVNGIPEITRLIVRRDLTLADSSTLPVLDFGAAEAFDAVKSQLSITGLGTWTGAIATYLHSPRSEMILALTSQTSAATRTLFGLPADRLAGGELQLLRLSAATGAGETRSAALYFRAPADRTLQLGAPLSDLAITSLATTPALRLRATFAQQSEYDGQTSIVFQQGLVPVQVNLSMSAKYASRVVGGHVLELPDLSGVEGFDPAWTLSPGSQVLWSATRIGGTLGFGRNAKPVDGATQISASRTGSYGP